MLFRSNLENTRSSSEIQVVVKNNSNKTISMLNVFVGNHFVGQIFLNENMEIIKEYPPTFAYGIGPSVIKILPNQSIEIKFLNLIYVCKENNNTETKYFQLEFATNEFGNIKTNIIEYIR